MECRPQMCGKYTQVCLQQIIVDYSCLGMMIYLYVGIDFWKNGIS